MPIHEKSLIRPEDLKTHDALVVEGVDVSGHWSTFIQSRVVTDYNEALQDEIAGLPGGEHIHRCWQCGSCTNACPRDVNPEGVMKALSHWLELKGHTPKSPSMIFDEVFSEQVIEHGKIEAVSYTHLRAHE